MTSRASSTADASISKEAGGGGTPSRRMVVGAWIIGLLALSAVVGIVLKFSELEQIAQMFRRIQPIWLLAAFLMQAATYVAAAHIWQIALARVGYRYRTRSLVPLALAMLFANQALPSAGMAGSAVVLRALGLRGVKENAAMAALLVGLLTQYAAFAVAISISLVVLTASHVLTAWLLWVVTFFAVGSVALPVGLLWYIKSAAAPRVRQRLAKVPVIGRVLVALASAPTDVLRDPAVLRPTIALQFAEAVLDAATLYVLLVALGVHASPFAVFASFVIAFAAALVGPTPLGLGTFEGASIAMLRAFGVHLEAALAATMLLRAYTLWLPMLPGFWCMRIILRPVKTSMASEGTSATGATPPGGGATPARPQHE